MDDYIPKRLAPGSRISRPTREGVIRDILSGILSADVAAKWNVNLSVVSRVRNSPDGIAAGLKKWHRVGSTEKTKKNQKNQKKQRRKIQALLDTGKTNKQIAIKLGCTPQNIWKIIKTSIRPSTSL